MEAGFHDIEPVPVPGAHRATVYFIHGFMGNSRTTWQANRRDPNSFWPEWLAKKYPALKVVTIQYKSPAVGESMSTEKKAQSIYETLEKRHQEPEKPFAFVCHSLGGILLKRVMLRAESESKADLIKNFKAAIFFGTPHSGTELVERGWLRALIALTGHRVLTDLSRNGSYLKLLQDMYEAFLLRRKTTFETLPEVYNFAYAENGKTWGVQIVPEASASLPSVLTPGDGERFTNSEPHEANHVNICKLRSPGDERFGRVEYYLERAFRPVGGLRTPNDLQKQDLPGAYRAEQQNSARREWFANVVGAVLVGACYLLAVLNALKPDRVEGSVMLDVTLGFAIPVAIGAIVAIPATMGLRGRNIFLHVIAGMLTVSFIYFLTNMLGG